MVNNKMYILKLEAQDRQTWFYEANKKAEIGKQKYWIYYKKGIVTVKTVKSGIKKAEFRFKTEKNQVWIENIIEQDEMKYTNKWYLCLKVKYMSWYRIRVSDCCLMSNK